MPGGKDGNQACDLIERKQKNALFNTGPAESTNWCNMTGFIREAKSLNTYHQGMDVASKSNLKRSRKDAWKKSHGSELICTRSAQGVVPGTACNGYTLPQCNRSGFDFCGIRSYFVYITMELGIHCCRIFKAELFPFTPICTYSRQLSPSIPFITAKATCFAKSVLWHHCLVPGRDRGRQAVGDM